MSDWQPHRTTTETTVDPAPVAALSALLDSGLPPAAVGEVLPPLWHWVALPRWSPSSLLGMDGHPRRGDFLPPIDDLPRRMFAGGEVFLNDVLYVGSRVEVGSTVTEVVEKEGRSGRFAVVRVRTRIRDMERGVVALEERQDIVFRPAAPAPDPDTLPEAASAAGLCPVERPLQRADRGWSFSTDPSLLMRFSSATANAHRIHYDWPYTTRVEGYPGLVVHGPLSTLVQAEVLRLEDPRMPRRLEHRNTAPLFCGEQATVTVSTPSPDLAEVALRGEHGAPVAGLCAVLAPASSERHNHE